MIADLLPLEALVDGHSLSIIIQLALGIIGSTFLVRLLTLRQDRRKIAGDASSAEANAASILSGTALQMVEAANRTAHEAEQRAEAAQRKVEDIKSQADEAVRAAQAEATRMWHELQKAGWEIHWLQIRERLLEMALRGANIDIPEIPASMLEAFPDWDHPPSAPALGSSGRHAAPEEPPTPEPGLDQDDDEGPKSSTVGG